MTTAHAPRRLASCLGQCAAAERHPAHHDRLLAVDTDVDVLLELLEIAVTWRELDYTDTPVAGPADWATFAERHAWRCPERAERAFSLALDIVGYRPEDAGPVPLASIIPLVRG